MTKEEFKEGLYSKVEHLPSEWAIKGIISDLIDEIYDLKYEQQRAKDLIVRCYEDLSKHGNEAGTQIVLSRFACYLLGD